MINSRSSINELQEYVAATEKERNFADQSAIEKCLLLGEEVGELFKAVRRTSGLAVDPNSKATEVGSELADVLNYILAIANRYQIDLCAEFVAKERINSGRNWISNAAQ
ncbi:MazG nucleotide pyrophosphohydrolase domain-containing protein [Novilysobacter spongiicola]|uniref:NTP pyrophosphatase, house-cleaning of non-canonical NTPs n=1 Tax=Lysobacter spongiicola DSM 21749 TaxID=1122188 RepID=A0A1T4RYF9_9GAMM|nr:MazG nucleotide pyrophosphohydrolase domain-containing protein [Lysobacter spongiicola]SKA21054.1 NTP pyrophosphatase, house-cleaning of non-canonical NTPs [Lysobacter spongiicola DSM 21749]